MNQISKNTPRWIYKTLTKRKNYKLIVLITLIKFTIFLSTQLIYQETYLVTKIKYLSLNVKQYDTLT